MPPRKRPAEDDDDPDFARMSTPPPPPPPPLPTAAAPTALGIAGVHINNDFCGTCGFGGELLCCERCPMAFHFICCDPPENPDKVLHNDEEWLCNACGPRKQRGPPVNAAPFKQLIDLTLQLNPTVFALPRNIPVEAKLDAASAVAAALPKDTHCFACELKGTEENALLQCSACPLSFHMDCLRQPLTHHPKSKPWLCPNHVDFSRRHARFSQRTMVTSTMKATVPLDFAQRFMHAPPHPSAADEQAFLDGVFELHRDYLHTRQLPTAGSAAALLGDSLAIHGNVAQMSMDERAAAISSLRALLAAAPLSTGLTAPSLAVLTESTQQVALQTFRPALVQQPTLRCISTGELFVFTPEQNCMQIGVTVPATKAGAPPPVPLDVDLSSFAVHAVLVVPGAFTGLIASIFRVPDAIIDDDDEEGDGPDPAGAAAGDNMATFQLTAATAEPVFVNGIECVAADDEATALPNNAIVELAGLRFCFQYPE